MVLYPPTPIRLKSMQKSMFLAVLRLIFALKTKIPPPNKIGVRVGEDCEMMMTSRRGCQRTWRLLEITWFWTGEFWQRPFFFEDHLILDRKILWISAKTFFFGDHLVFTEQLPQSKSRLIKIRVKFLYGWIKLQKSPPFAKSWLRDRVLEKLTHTTVILDLGCPTFSQLLAAKYSVNALTAATNCSLSHFFTNLRFKPYNSYNLGTHAKHYKSQIFKLREFI